MAELTELRRGWHSRAPVRWLGLDVGSKTIGIAVSDELGTLATPLKTVRRRSNAMDVKCVCEVLAEYGVEGIVIGLPLELSGAEGTNARRIRQFGDQLAQATSVPMHYWDERFSTAQAQRVLIDADLSRKKRKQVIDHVAACLILQGYLAAQQQGND